MAQIVFSIVALIIAFLQGYFFPDALFKFMPFVVESLRRKTKGYYDGRTKEFIIRALAMLAGGGVIILVLPGFLQFGVVSVLGLTTVSVGAAAKSSAAGWFFGILTKGLVAQIAKAKEKGDNNN